MGSEVTPYDRICPLHASDRRAHGPLCRRSDDHCLAVPRADAAVAARRENPTGQFPTRHLWIQPEMMAIPGLPGVVNCNPDAKMTGYDDISW